MNTEPTLFRLSSSYQPMGDQPRAIEALMSHIREGTQYQTLLGVTGSGKTFTMANVIQALGRPTLILSHNKTLAAQLYQEFKSFFPESAVHYFVSYYDYYQPEAYLPVTDTYIEKDAKINTFLDQLRHAATAAVLTRRDVIVVASVSAIYGLADPDEYRSMAVHFRTGETVQRSELLRALAMLQYSRNEVEKTPGTFRVKGELVEIYAPDGNTVTRIELFGSTIDRIKTGKTSFPDPLWETAREITVFPAKHFVTGNTKLERAITNIDAERDARVTALRAEGKILEAERLNQRTMFDIAMLKETGYCSGIENYSRHIEGRAPGTPPHTLIDYFPKGFITFVDESHMTLPQIRGMYNGDRARKQTLVDFGFRMPSAIDNRPLTFEEFEIRTGTTVYVSATPNAFEMDRGPVVEQLIRPTGLLDPTISIEPIEGQVESAAQHILERASRSERSLVTCLTKRNAEDLSEYLEGKGIRVTYLHSDIKTLERPDILRKLRLGDIDAIVGINLLREGLDLPEVSLICILDADKEGFLRNDTTLIQTIGRAARHPTGHVVFYADRVTGSMQRALDETARRRKLQESYNVAHGITPTALGKPVGEDLFESFRASKKRTPAELAKIIQKNRHELSERALKRELEQEMIEAANQLDFERAAEIRDVIKSLDGVLPDVKDHDTL
ncbi:MAG: excinuclease ABC subunit UvrB [Patescibacteria group bacterium]